MPNLPGDLARASLKPEHRIYTGVAGRHLPGDLARASLKHQECGHRRVRVLVSPGRSRPGLIEAWTARLRRRRRSPDLPGDLARASLKRRRRRRAGAPGRAHLPGDLARASLKPGWRSGRGLGARYLSPGRSRPGLIEAIPASSILRRAVRNLPGDLARASLKHGLQGFEQLDPVHLPGDLARASLKLSRWRSSTASDHPISRAISPGPH